MIEINLLPPEFRPKKKVSFEFEKINLFIPSILLFIFGIHILLLLLTILSNIRYSVLNKNFQANKSDLEKIEIWRKENQIIQQEQSQMLKLKQKTTPIYPKLKILSKAIPNGMWFNRLDIKSKNLKLEGSVVSLQSDHVSIFRNFCDNLKKDKDFSKDLASFEIGPLKNRKLSGYEILDFSIELKFK